MRFAPNRLALLLVAAFAAAEANSVRADDVATSAFARTAAQLLPAETVFYAEIPRPKALVDTLLAHPLRMRAEGLPAYRGAVLSKEYLQFQFGLGIAQTALGMKWDEAVEALAGEGVYFGFDAKAQAGVVLVRGRDAQKLATIRDRLLEFARADARGKDRPDPIADVEHRGATIHKIGEAYAATLGPWLMLTNKLDAGKAVVDRALDADAKTLAASAEFVAAIAEREKEPTAWAYVDVKALRDYGALAKVLRDKSDNPGAELLIGGLLSTLGQTPYATASLSVSNESVRLVVGAPHEADWVAKPREFYFGPEGKGVAPAPLLPKEGAALSLVTHRDLSGIWVAAAELFDEKANAELSKADSELSQLFGGKEFGREILGAFGPQVQLLAVRQDYAKQASGLPEIKIPGAALVLSMKDPAKTQQQLKVTFQSVIGFLNIVGGMSGYPPLDMNTERRGKDLLVTSEYMMEADGKQLGGKMFHNFSPSIVIVGDRFIISSTKALAESLADVAKEQDASKASGSAASPAVNTALHLNATIARQVLEDNRAQLVAQNVLEKGHDKKKAEAEIGTISEIVSWFKSGDVALLTPPGKVELKVEINFAQSKAEPVKK